MKHYLVFLYCILANCFYAQSKYQKDFQEFWEDVNNNYAYLKEQQINWEQVKQIYEAKAAMIKSDDAFIAFLEELLNELYNGHSTLNTNLKSSNRIVPSGQDLYVEKIKEEYVITDIKKNSGAEKSGLKIGQRIVKFNGAAVEPQLAKFLPKYTNNYLPAMYQYALDMLFAGTHDVKRKIEVMEGSRKITCYPDSVSSRYSVALLEAKVLNEQTAYIKINNCLYNNRLIAVFDSLLDQYMQYKNLVIDLSETPAGGNTTVARAIMGRFISSNMPYQQHVIDEDQYQTKRVWMEYVVPRKEMFKGNVYVVVGHWTGSMGEGIAIGFSALKRATIVGTEMAKLLGAIENFKLTETHIGYQIPTEKLYHINGTPREQFKPDILTKNSIETWEFIRKLK